MKSPHKQNVANKQEECFRRMRLDQPIKAIAKEMQVSVALIRYYLHQGKWKAKMLSPDEFAKLMEWRKCQP